MRDSDLFPIPHLTQFVWPKLCNKSPNPSYLFLLINPLLIIYNDNHHSIPNTYFDLYLIQENVICTQDEKKLQTCVIFV